MALASVTSYWTRFCQDLSDFWHDLTDLSKTPRDELNRHLPIQDLVALVLGYWMPRPRMEISIPIPRERIQKIRPHLFLDEKTNRLWIVSYGFSQDFVVQQPYAETPRFGLHEDERTATVVFLQQDDRKPPNSFEYWLAKQHRQGGVSSSASSRDGQIYCHLITNPTGRVDALNRPVKKSVLSVFRLRPDQDPERIGSAEMKEESHDLACDWDPESQSVLVLLRDATTIWWSRFCPREKMKWNTVTASLFWTNGISWNPRPKTHSFHAVDAQSHMAFRVDWDDSDSDVRLLAVDLTTDFFW